ncbi:hypothetical protein PUN28_004201 [Cardiocondyla obscurior]|uniref:Uncharacterized protein n=1 Tax=Cardiocondyla obscurior TaxID=286306 RepID=A0AAW2GPZ7_9HYME
MAFWCRGARTIHIPFRTPFAARRQFLSSIINKETLVQFSKKEKNLLLYVTVFSFVLFEGLVKFEAVRELAIPKCQQ